VVFTKKHIKRIFRLKELSHEIDFKNVYFLGGGLFYTYSVVTPHWVCTNLRRTSPFILTAVLLSEFCNWAPGKPFVPMLLSGHSPQQPRSAATLSGHAQRPCSAATLSSHAQRPRSAATLSGYAQRLHSAATLSGHAQRPRSAATFLNGHAQRPRSSAATLLSSHAPAAFVPFTSLSPPPHLEK